MFFYRDILYTSQTMSGKMATPHSTRNTLLVDMLEEDKGMKLQESLHPLGTCSKTPRTCPKLQIVLNSIYTLYFPIHAYL